MPTNDFLAFGTTPGSNVLDQPTYVTDFVTWGGLGFTTGTAQSIQLNKVWRQGTIGTKLIGDLINTYLGADALDNEDLVTLKNNFFAALRHCVNRAPNVVPYSVTPTFDASLSDVQEITLTGNVTSSNLTNTYAGQKITFIIHQDATGGRTFVWPASVLGAGTIDPGASTTSVQKFVVDNTGAIRAADPMISS